MKLNKIFNLSLILILSSAVSGNVQAAEQKASGKVLGRLISGAKILINGEPAKVGQLVMDGAKIDAQGGGAVIEIDGNRVLQVSEGSVATLSTTADSGAKCCNVFLEKGRVEGVNRMGVSKELSGISVTTPTGRIEAEGGRYVVQVDSNGTQVESVDGGVTVQSLNGKNPAKVSLAAGESTSLAQDRSIAAISTINSTTPTTTLDVMRTETNIAIQTPQTTPTSFQSISINPIIPSASNISQDPLQPVGNANVSVKFKY